MIRFIFYIFVFYVVIKILRVLIDPLFDKKGSRTDVNELNTQASKKPIVGEYIEYEEVK